jgi:hypothetical protein
LFTQSLFLAISIDGFLTYFTQKEENEETRDFTLGSTQKSAQYWMKYGKLVWVDPSVKDPFLLSLLLRKVSF